MSVIRLQSTTCNQKSGNVASITHTVALRREPHGHVVPPPAARILTNKGRPVPASGRSRAHTALRQRRQWVVGTPVLESSVRRTGTVRSRRYHQPSRREAASMVPVCAAQLVEGDPPRGDGTSRTRASNSGSAGASFRRGFLSATGRGPEQEGGTTPASCRVPRSGRTVGHQYRGTARAQPPSGPENASPRVWDVPCGASSVALPPLWNSTPGRTHCPGARAADPRTPVGEVPPPPLRESASHRIAYRTSNRRIHVCQSVAGHAYTTRKEEGVSSA